MYVTRGSGTVATDATSPERGNAIFTRRPALSTRLGSTSVFTASLVLVLKSVRGDSRLLFHLGLVVQLLDDVF